MCFRFFALVGLLLGGGLFAFAGELCPSPFLQKDLTLFIEGAFVGREQVREHLSVEWKHHEGSALDTFEMVSGAEQFTYSTDGTSRKLQTVFRGVRSQRQMAEHHLKERIGKTPLRYGDLELLANGTFLCPTDSSRKNRFSTAYSQMWYHITADTLPEPSRMIFSGAQRIIRILKIDSWNSFSEIRLPSVLRIEEPDGFGTLWLHSVQTKKNEKTFDPLLSVFKEKRPLPTGETPKNRILFPQWEKLFRALSP